MVGERNLDPSGRMRTSTWTAEAIEQRAQALIDLALAAWPFFGPDSEAGSVAQSGVEDASVVGTIPVSVRLRGEDRPVQSWVDVAVVTMEGIAALGDDEFGRVARCAGLKPPAEARVDRRYRGGAS